MVGAPLPSRRSDMKALAAGVANAAILGGCALGPPVALYWGVGWPLSRIGLGPGDWRHFLTTPLPDRAWPGILAVVGWLLWLWWMAALLWELASALRDLGTESHLLDRGKGAARPMRHTRALVRHSLTRAAVAGAIIATVLSHGGRAGALAGASSRDAVVLAPAGGSNAGENIGFGVSGAGIAWTLERLRRVQRRHRPLGAMVRPPDVHLRATEILVHERSDTASMHADRVNELLDSAQRISTVDIPTWPRHGNPEAAEIEICVLGPVELRGMSREVSRGASLELIVYLALHPHGIDRASCSASLWPDRLVSKATMDSTVSVARSALGRARDGNFHLPTGRGLLRLGRGVATDWDRFVALTDPSDVRCRRPEEALGLIRGPLFQGLRRDEWTLYEGISPMIESRIADVAIAHGERCLEIGDAPTAEWSARQGLRISPYDERLFRILMRAAHAQGNRARILAIMQELRTLVDEDVEPFDTVHPETERLFRELTGRAGDGGPVTPGARSASVTKSRRMRTYGELAPCDI